MRLTNNYLAKKSKYSLLSVTRINKILLQITITLIVKIILSTRILIGQDFDISNFLIQI